MFTIYQRLLLLTSSLTLLLFGQAFAEDTFTARLEAVSHNAKLVNAATTLASLEQGAERVDVVVGLSLPGTAIALSEHSAAVSTEVASIPKGTLYFNLQDDEIKQQLMEMVSVALDSSLTLINPYDVAVTRRFTYVFGFAASVTLDGLEQLLAMDEVSSVSEDLVLEAHLAQGIPLMRATTPRSTYRGSGISIAICDTGIDTAHPRLGGGGTPIFNAKVIGGYDTGDNDGDPRPSPSGNAHGTACAGISAGSTGTVGDYIGGVAPEAKLYALKISTGDTGNATASAMVAAWEWAVTHQNDDPANPIMIISTSFGGHRFFSSCDTADSPMTQAAANAVAAGITIFASSGNDGYCDSMGWPACISTVISVGAVYDANFGTYYPCVSASSCAPKTVSGGGCTSGYYATDATAPDKVTSYSNSASFLSIFGPANQAYTTDIVGSGGYTTGDYTSSFGGTSAACPYVAGAAAVLQNAAKTITGSYLSPSQVQYFLTTYGDMLTDSKVAISKPRVNLQNSVVQLSSSPSDFPWNMFLTAIMSGDSPPPPPPIPKVAQWGVFTRICCSTSSAIFSVTMQPPGETKYSTSANCATEATFSGFSNTATGAKSFSAKISSAGCGPLTWQSFSHTFLPEKRYLLRAELDAGKPVISIYSMAIPTGEAMAEEAAAKFSFDTEGWGLEETVNAAWTIESQSEGFFDQCRTGWK